MGSGRRRPQAAVAVDMYVGKGLGAGADCPSTLEKNVQAIKRWGKTILLMRSNAEQVSDWIARRTRIQR
jgi:hypothetical protein